MSSDNSSYDGLEIDVSELTSHQQHLGGVIDRTSVAFDASRVPLTADAFGLLGSLLAGKCSAAQSEGADAINEALAASRDHYPKVGAWANDLDEHELNVIDMFSVIDTAVANPVE